MSKVSIIGGGIGGLTLGIALKRKNIDFQIFEATDEYKNVGAGITLRSNAMKVLEYLDIVGDIQKRGTPHNTRKVVDIDGNVMDSANLEREIKAKYGYTRWGIHRKDLQEIQLEHVGSEFVQMGKECVDVEKETNSVRLEFSDGTFTETSNPVVGADGMHSNVRSALFPEIKVDYINIVGHRGFPEMTVPKELQNTFYMVKRDDSRLGVVPIADGGKVFWFVNEENEPGKMYDKEKVKSKILTRFENAPDPIPGLIKTTPPESILSPDYSEVPPMETWIEGNVVLMGDAAHGMTPFLAQGAGQAIEDAYVLAECLDSFTTFHEAFEKYEELRLNRADEIARLARRLGEAWNAGEVPEVSKIISGETLQDLFEFNYGETSEGEMFAR